MNAYYNWICYYHHFIKIKLFYKEIFGEKLDVLLHRYKLCRWYSGQHKRFRLRFRYRQKLLRGIYNYVTSFLTEYCIKLEIMCSTSKRKGIFLSTIHDLFTILSRNLNFKRVMCFRNCLLYIVFHLIIQLFNKFFFWKCWV